MKAKHIVLAVGLASLAASVAHGRDLLWTWYNARTWDLETSRQNWADMGYDYLVRTYFQNGDNVLFDEERVPTMDSVTVGANVAPGNLVFNITNAFTASSGAYNFFAANRIVKNGPGTLTWHFASSGNGYTTPVEINEGVLVCSNPNGYGGYVPVQNNALREYIINSGAELRVIARNCFGKVDLYTLTGAGGGCVRLKKGGKFSLYLPDQSNHVGSSVWDLYLEGGALDFQAKGANDSLGLLLINHKLSVSGDTAYVITNTPGYSYQHLAINKSTPTIFDIADVTGNDDPDLTLDLALTQYPGGTPQLIKQGAGTMRMLYRNSLFKSDMVIKEGTISCDYHAGQTSEFGGNNTTILGDMTVAGRKITVCDSGCLEFKQRNLFTSYGAGENGGNSISTELFVTNGGTVLVHGAANLGPLTVADGNIRFAVTNYGWGAFSVRGTMKVRGKTPFELRFQGQQCRQILYRNYATVFDVADVTGDAAADFTTGLPFVMPDYKDYYTDSATGEIYPYGFVKTGAGTMVTTGDSYSAAIAMNGEARVTEGTLQVDGNIGRSSAVVVSAGAYLAGTGTVNNVQIAAGGGFRKTANQAEPLKLRGNLTIGANPVFYIDNPNGLDRKKIRTPILTVTGTVTGAENLANATVYLDGVAQVASAWAVGLENGRLSVKGVAGTMFVVQ